MNENIYVSSRGILKSCDYYSYNPVSSINKIYNYPPISAIKNIPNPSIYVCGNAIMFLCKKLWKIFALYYKKI